MTNQPNRPGSSRRIGSASGPASSGPPATRASLVIPQRASSWFLRAWAIAFVLPAAVRMLSGDVAGAVGIILGMVMLFFAGGMIKEGLRTESELASRKLVRAPKVRSKLMGSLLASAGVFLIASLGAIGGPAMGIVFAGLVFAGCVLAFGWDAKTDRDAIAQAAERAGVTPERVIATLEEAHGKIADIEARASSLQSRELKDRVARICARARDVLAQLEADPSDLSRARRFLVTYLDGTRDVIGKYAKQQHDIAESELQASFRRVLDTIEQVFGEQVELLKKDDRTDLEVKIDVLETQLKNEGVH